MKRMTKNEAFEFLKCKKTMVVDEEQSKLVQNKLFEIGFKWPFEGKKICYTDMPFLFTNICCYLHTSKSLREFMVVPLELIEPLDILAIEIVDGKEEKKEPQFEYGQLVLVRHNDTNIWLPALFLSEHTKYGDYRYRMFGGNIYKQCIPYEGNEHLRGTSNNKEE